MFLIVTLIILCQKQVFSQSPSAFNYQAVLRDVSGNIRTNASVTLRIDLLQGSATGFTVYAESFSANTNAFGLINIQVGKGAVISGTFSTINWAGGPYFIKVSVDGIEMGTSQLMSVPYALYAGSGDYNSLINKPVNYNSNLENLWAGNWSFMENTTGAYNIALGSYTLYHNSEGKYNVSIGNESLFKNTTGNDNVAIGEYTLYSNTIGRNNIALGENALYANVDGWNNTALGAFALGANESGDNNIAIGRDALRSNTTANSNIGIGNNTLNDNISGEDNIAIGPYSLTHNTTGDKNIALGRDALNKNTTGNFNIALGESALFSNNIGRWNIALGNFALSKNGSGDKLTAIGYEALKECTGWDNTAVGYQSLRANTDGFDNVALGVSSLSSNTTGDGNTAVGKNAMSVNITGNNNTAIGFNANVLEGISNSTAIGYDALVTSSNKIVIGNASATTVGGYGSWTNYSDRRLKENIEYRNNLGLNFITRLKPASYNYIKDSNKRRRDGFIAQDVEQTLKELGIEFSGLVIDNNKDKTQNLSYAEFVVPLVAAVQELNQENLLLKHKNAQMEASLEQMKIEIQQLKQLILIK
jgi:hypothetical protein